MELRNAEKEMNSLTSLYKCLQTSYDGITPWGQLRSLQGQEDNDLEEEGDPLEEKTSPSEILDALNTMKSRMETMEPLATKFRQRMKMKDPITNAPRYGGKTMARVVQLLDSYDTISLALDIAFGNPDDKDKGRGSAAVVAALERNIQADKDKALASKHMLEKEIQGRQEEEKKLREKQSKYEEQKEEENRLRMERERAELSARAEIARIQRIENERNEVELERIAQQAFLDSINIGVDGVKSQLGQMEKSCSKSEFSIALGALHTLFSQIQSQPEEIKFRRIRRDHPKFNEDIGRHNGGKEMLIAAGFKFVEIDGIKCFFSKEPDLASDMDGWSDWFNLIKETVAIIEEEMIK
jgi:hypothetical protein